MKDTKRLSQSTEKYGRYVCVIHQSESGVSPSSTISKATLVGESPTENNVANSTIEQENKSQGFQAQNNGIEEKVKVITPPGVESKMPEVANSENFPHDIYHKDAQKFTETNNEYHENNIVYSESSYIHKIYVSNVT